MASSVSDIGFIDERTIPPENVVSTEVVAPLPVTKAKVSTSVVRKVEEAYPKDTNVLDE